MCQLLVGAGPCQISLVSQHTQLKFHGLIVGAHGPFPLRVLVGVYCRFNSHVQKIWWFLYGRCLCAREPPISVHVCSFFRFRIYRTNLMGFERQEEGIKQGTCTNPNFGKKLGMAKGKLHFSCQFRDLWIITLFLGFTFGFLQLNLG